MPAPLALIEDGPPPVGRIVTLRGEIDVGSTPSLRDWLTRASDGGRRSVAVDLTGVDFMAVSGLYVLCDEQARMARHRARLTVVCSNPRFLHLFEVCRLEDVLCIVPDRAALSEGVWDDGDEQRATRLDAWLQRYAAGAAPAEPPVVPPSPPPTAS
jgi:anti-sigma B factor antagonist